MGRQDNLRSRRLTDIGDGFTRVGVHDLMYKDDFGEFAQQIRDELLGFPDWIEMPVDSYDGAGRISPASQNGITTGHLRNNSRARLPACMAFRDVIRIAT